MTGNQSVHGLACRAWVVRVKNADTTKPYRTLALQTQSREHECCDARHTSAQQDGLL